MKFFNKRLISAILLSSALVACSSDDEDEAPVIAELTEIEELFEAEVVWDDSVGDGVGHYFSRLSPAIAYDKVFVSSRFGDAYAFDVNTGDELWNIDLSDIEDERGFFDDAISARIAGGAVTGYNKVIWGSENGDVFAIEEDSGKLAWRAKVSGEVISKPALDSNLVIVNTASGALVALDITSGEEVWKAEQSVPPLTLRGVSGVSASSGGAFVGLASGEVGVYILENGQQGWITEIGEPSGSTELERIVDVDVTPVIMGDKIYAISTNGNLAALDLRSGREVWKRKYSSYRQLTVAGNQIFATDTQGHVFAIDRNSGIEQWSQLAFTGRSTTGAASVGDYVVVGDFEGYLHWLSKADGSIVARHEVDSSGIYNTPLVHNGLLYVMSRDGDLEVIKTPEIVTVNND
ncbi:outer membrane protein assembly factor BamB [Thalassomonas sp. M1454]|uniref:outer membrane protein assembly factor BamB n=1 Tax=Thalassomonas sp. M1454 TaxID=2594477 RepID=UPI00117C249C|nr:outer membrane protein assembly factor BamB [Thalassomonas sp. M1454]TRX53971.1 outer membrane protein assembly factor BamB [Thalassomonas sp. M1454]